MSLLKKLLGKKETLVTEVKDLTEEVKALKDPEEKKKVLAELAEIKKLEDAKLLAEEQAKKLRDEVDAKPLAEKSAEQQKQDVDDALKALHSALN